MKSNSISGHGVELNVRKLSAASQIMCCSRSCCICTRHLDKLCCDTVQCATTCPLTVEQMSCCCCSQSHDKISWLAILRRAAAAHYRQIRKLMNVVDGFLSFPAFGPAPGWSSPGLEHMGMRL